jgi:hypothetical protein
MNQKQRFALMQEKLNNQIALENTKQLMKDVALAAVPQTPKEVISQVTVTGAVVGAAHLLDLSGVGMGIAGAVASIGFMALRSAVTAKEEWAELNTRLRTGRPSEQSDAVARAIEQENEELKVKDGKGAGSCAYCNRFVPSDAVVCPACGAER